MRSYQVKFQRAARGGSCGSSFGSCGLVESKFNLRRLIFSRPPSRAGYSVRARHSLAKFNYAFQVIIASPLQAVGLGSTQQQLSYCLFSPAAKRIAGERIKVRGKNKSASYCFADP